jgi:diacylglycerol kinase (ATP)
LNPLQVYDLKAKHADPSKVLLKFQCFLPNLRVLVCGGDGTVSWILSVIDKLRIEKAYQRPPVAVLPLGTGNDLSRCFGWGATTYANISDIRSVLDDIAWRCNIEVLDRFNIHLVFSSSNLMI